MTITINGVTIAFEKIAAAVKITKTKTAATTTFVEVTEVFDRIIAYIQNVTQLIFIEKYIRIITCNFREADHRDNKQD